MQASASIDAGKSGTGVDRLAVILGAGTIGSVMAIDLLTRQPRFRVRLVDRDGQRLEAARARIRRAIVGLADDSDAFVDGVLAHVEVATADLTDPGAVAGATSGAAVVLGALSSVIGLRAMRAVIDAGVRRYVDVSFMGEDPTESLDAVAHERGAVVVYDCGVAPGMSNLLTGYADARTRGGLGEVEILVGGLPIERRWPFEYRAGFAPRDVIEEYTRPSRLRRAGRERTVEALTDCEFLDLPGVGTLEAFNTDGLRSLLRTIDAPDMVEKTIRYPGHADLMRILRHIGLFSHEPIELPTVLPSATGNATGAPAARTATALVRPIDVTEALLFPHWQFGEGERDRTVMRVRTRSKRGDQAMTWSLNSVYDDRTGCTSMQRTTAFPATIMARLLVEEAFARPGVHPPEIIGRETPALAERMLEELRARDINFEFSSD